MAPLMAFVYRARSAGESVSHRLPRVAFANALKSSSPPTAARVLARGASRAGDGGGVAERRGQEERECAAEEGERAIERHVGRASFGAARLDAEEARRLQLFWRGDRRLGTLVLRF